MKQKTENPFIHLKVLLSTSLHYLYLRIASMRAVIFENCRPVVSDNELTPVASRDEVIISVKACGLSPPTVNTLASDDLSTTALGVLSLVKPFSANSNPNPIFEHFVLLM